MKSRDHGAGDAEEAEKKKRIGSNGLLDARFPRQEADRLPRLSRLSRQKDTGRTWNLANDAKYLVTRVGSLSGKTGVTR